MMMTQDYLNRLTHDIIGVAIDVHRELGPGLLESVYEKCFAFALEEDGFIIESQKSIPVNFRGMHMDCDLRYDLLVEDAIIVEIKATNGFQPIHEAQLMTYLKLLNKPKGILINFNSTNIFKEGQKTIVTPMYALLPRGY